MMQDTGRATLEEAKERYREVLVFNNELLKKNYPERYEFNTQRKVDDARRRNLNEKLITDYEAARTRDYDKKFKAYSERLDKMVDGAVVRYARGLEDVFPSMV